MRSYADVVRSAKQQASPQGPPSVPVPRPTPPTPVATPTRRRPCESNAYLQRDSVPDPIDCVYAWDCALPADAWGPDPALVRWIIDHVPSERIISAFERDPRLFAESDKIRRERSRPVGAAAAKSDDEFGGAQPVVPVASLYGLCVRVLVPFAVANAMLQARLPMLAGVVHFARNMTPRDTEARVIRAPPDTLPCQQRTYDDDAWWVSCCGCDKRHTRSCAAVPCPRGWFRRIHERDALRLMAWHWGDQIDIRRLPGPMSANESGCYCRGLYEYPEWSYVIGRPRSCMLGSTVDDMSRAVMISCCCMIMPTRGTVHECQTTRAQAASMARVHHPWDSRIDVSHRTDCDGDWHIVAAVEGDDLFAVEIYP